MIRNPSASMVRSRQETFNSNGGHEARFGDFQLPITVVYGQKHKVWVLVFLDRTIGTD